MSKTNLFTTALFIFAVFGAVTANAQVRQMPMKFDFGSGKTANGYTQILPANVYSSENGYGFEPNQSVRCLDRNDKNALRSDFCTSDKPFYFSVKVTEGNYKVTVTFGDKTEATATTVKAELRRLMLEKVETVKGKFATETFIVNVRTPIFPAAK